MLPSTALVEGLRERREEHRPRGGHVPAVLEPHPELAGNVESRLIGEAHARLERGCIAVDEIRGFVSIESDSVARAVGEPRKLIAGTPALALVEAAHGVVDAAGRHADFRGL